jgi:hypothetical protein
VEQGHNPPDHAGDTGPQQGRKSPRSGKAPPVGSRWKKGQSGNPKGRPKGTGLTDSLKRLVRGSHNGKPIADLLAESMLKHALSGKFQHLKELFDRLEGRPTETVKAAVEVGHRHYVVPPPRVLGEEDGEYRARIDLEQLASDHRRMIEGRGDEGAG